MPATLWVIYPIGRYCRCPKLQLAADELLISSKHHYSSSDSSSQQSSAIAAYIKHRFGQSISQRLHSLHRFNLRGTDLKCGYFYPAADTWQRPFVKFACWQRRLFGKLSGWKSPSFKPFSIHQLNKAQPLALHSNHKAKLIFTAVIKYF